MPTADASLEGKIYQFIGTTDQNYTNGYFYKCVSDGAVTPTYSWERIDVQPAVNPLPSQSGNSGKFLTTDGTDASWDTTIEDTLSIKLSSSSTDVLGLKLYYGANQGLTLMTGAIGWNILCGYPSNTPSIGGVKPYGYDKASIRSSEASYRDVVLGNSSSKWYSVYTKRLNNGSDITVPTVDGTLALQIATMPTAGSTYEGTIYQYTGATDSTYTNGYFYKCVSDGQSPATYSWENIEIQPALDPLPSQTGNAGKVLTTNGTTASWVDMTTTPQTAPVLQGTATYWITDPNTGVISQTINVQGVTASNTVLVGPAPVSAEDYATAGIICTAQGNGTLTFTCQTIPSVDLTLNVVCF